MAGASPQNIVPLEPKIRKRGVALPLTPRYTPPSKTIDKLIINSPYSEPAEHWRYDRESRLFSRAPGRRPAGYVRASDNSKAFDDPGIFIELPLPNKIRPRVNAWREANYPGVRG